MLTKLASLAFVLASAVACGVEPSSNTHDGFVIERIDREVSFTEPVATRLFVGYRAVSYPGRIVEYGVEVDGAPLVVTYAIDPAANRPLQTRIYDGVTFEPKLAVLADDRTLDVIAGDEATLTVDGYTTPAQALVSGDAMAVAASLRPLLDAVLPARVELAPVPAFWQNVDQRADTDGDIGQTSSSGRPLIGSWSAPVSLLGALFLQTPCIADAGYRCPCMHLDMPAIGTVETCASQP
jgi:hypothetical protein